MSNDYVVEITTESTHEYIVSAGSIQEALDRGNDLYHSGDQGKTVNTVVVGDWAIKVAEDDDGRID